MSPCVPAARALVLSIVLGCSLAACENKDESAEAKAAGEQQTAPLDQATQPAPLEAPPAQPVPVAVADPAPAVRPAPVARPKPRVAAAPPPPPPPAICRDCGTIVAIEPVKTKGQGTGMGAIAGAVAGAVAGHQFGQGQGKDVATAAGAAGGAYAGHQIEKEIRSSTAYHVSVRMEDDTMRVLDVADASGYTVGARVRFTATGLQPM